MDDNVIPSLYELSIKVLGLRLGDFRQYPPRELRGERFPVAGKTTELPAIAIVTPSYNQGNVIAQTIASVLDQAYPRLEYLSWTGVPRTGRAMFSTDISSALRIA